MPLAMHRRCPIFWRKSQRTSRYSASAVMAPMIPGIAMPVVPGAVPMRSSRSAAMGNHRRKAAPASMLAMKRYA